MTLGFLFPIGGSFRELNKSKQKERFKNYDLKYYSKYFKNINIFSYENETETTYKNCRLFPNVKRLNRFIYSLFIPFIYAKEFKEVDIIRASHLTGTTPAIVAKLLYQKPFVFNYGYDYSKFAKIENKIIMALLLKVLSYIAVKFADGIIAANLEIENSLKNIKKKVIYIPNGVDTKLFSFKTKKEHEYFTILFVGRLEKQKNLENLIKAISLIKKVQIKTIFIGQGSLKSELIRYAKQNQVDLKIIPPVLNEKLPNAYHEADIFALVSSAEGHSKVILEAQSCGLPVLASREGSINQIKDNETGILCNLDAEDIAGKINLMIKSKLLRKKIAKNARKEIEKKYSIDYLMEKEIKFLMKIYVQSA